MSNNFWLTYISLQILISEKGRLQRDGNLTDVTAEYLLKYCSTCWLYIGKVIVRIMEQMENIKEQFLTFLPAQKGFINKNGVGNAEHYQKN